jgi:membrane protein DedA with SNARE-associated domain
MLPRAGARRTPDLARPGGPALGVLLAPALALADPSVPSWFGILGWFTSPTWFHHFGRLLAHFVALHQTIGLFLVIFAEEMGIPLPAPGDVAITWAGYLTTTNAIPHAMAYVAVVAGAVLGSFCLYSISRRFGHRFLVRFGRYVGLDEERLQRVERAFRRWGPWAIIIGRHIPGLRIVISACAGAFSVPAKIFVPCVAISATIWAAIFIELGRTLGRDSRLLFRIVPVHLLPLLVLVLVVLFMLYTAYERAWLPRARSRRREGRKGHAPFES